MEDSPWVPGTVASPPPVFHPIPHKLRGLLLLSLSVGHRHYSQHRVSTRPCAKDYPLTCCPCLSRAPPQLWLGDFLQLCPPWDSVLGSLRSVSSIPGAPWGSYSSSPPPSALLGNSLEPVPLSSSRALLTIVLPCVRDGCPLCLMPRILEISTSRILCDAVALLFNCFWQKSNPLLSPSWCGSPKWKSKLEDPQL